MLGPEGVPTADNMRKLTYGESKLPEASEKHCSRASTPNHPVRAVLNETLRLFTPLPLSIRDARDEGVVLPRSDVTYSSPPMYIPPGMPVLFAFHLLQTNKALWGPDAEEFKPERWLDEELQRKVAANPAIYTPFSSGPRIVSVPYTPRWLGPKLNECSVSARTLP